MDIFYIIKIFQILMAITAFLLAVVTSIMAFRFRVFFKWRRSLSNDLKLFKKQVDPIDGPRQKAQQIVVDTCENIQHAFLADIKLFDQLPQYICSIAACFYPEKDHPEQCISIGNSLFIIQEIAFRLDQLFQKPVLNQFRQLRIRHIVNIYDRLKRMEKNVFFSFYLKYRKIIQKISFIRLIIIPDPFSWIFYLSNQLTIISITRYMLLEIYLYVGRLSIDAYGQSGDNQPISLSNEELEALMSDLEKIQAVTSPVDMPQLSKIRKKRLGLGKGLLSELSFEQWKKAISESSIAIASYHFADSDQPLLEASVGPLLDRCRYYIKTINTIQSIPVVYKLADVKIEVFFQAKLALDNVPPQLKQAISSTLKLYRWAKWPITIFRLAQKLTPAGIASSLGWMLTKNSLVFYGYYYTFYFVCNELNIIYTLSHHTIPENKSIAEMK